VTSTSGGRHSKKSKPAGTGRLGRNLPRRQGWNVKFVGQRETQEVFIMF